MFVISIFCVTGNELNFVLDEVLKYILVSSEELSSLKKEMVYSTKQKYA